MERDIRDKNGVPIAIGDIIMYRNDENFNQLDDSVLDFLACEAGPTCYERVWGFLITAGNTVINPRQHPRCRGAFLVGPKSRSITVLHKGPDSLSQIIDSMSAINENQITSTWPMIEERLKAYEFMLRHPSFSDEAMDDLWDSDHQGLLTYG